MDFLSTLIFITSFLVVNGQDVKSEFSTGKSRKRRDTVGFTTRRWPKGVVPYRISPVAKKETKDAFYRAIKTIQKLSCIKFVERMYERDYIRVVTGNGCYSMIGRQGGKQFLSLGFGCYRKGVAEHELLHVLGFYHEQSRLDRDRHVTIHQQNVLPSAKKQFSKYRIGEGHTLGTKYDPDSLMHYSNNAFSKNGRKTITYNKDPNKKLGRKSKLSETDISQLNKLYGCNEPNDTSKLLIKSCNDYHSGHCMMHFLLGACNSDPRRMQYFCPRTCGFCHNDCHDTASNCQFLSFFGLCHQNANVRRRCQKTCGFC